MDRSPLDPLPLKTTSLPKAVCSLSILCQNVSFSRPMLSWCLLEPEALAEASMLLFNHLPWLPTAPDKVQHSLALR